MSKLEQLIQELCPDGVEYKSISELIKRKVIITITPLLKIKKNDYKETGQTPIVSQEIEYISGYCDETDEHIVTDKYVCFGDHSEHIKYIDFAFVQGADGLKIMKTDESVLLTRFFYHSAMCFYKRHNNYERHFKYLNDTVVPVPPIEVQNEIVRILDNFTELTTELTAKLSEEQIARKKQYEYYRDELILLHDAPRMPLSKLTLKVGSVNWKNTNGTKKYIDLSSVDRDTHSILDADVLEVSAENAPSRAKQLVKENDILFGGTRPTLKRYCIVPTVYDEQVCSTGYCVLRVNNKTVLTNFVYHCLGTSDFYRYVEANQQGTSYPAIGDKALKEYEIPVPPIEEQNRIVSILDRFDTLCNDISNGLPAEIEARQKQYEYYRDKLLTFKELS